MKYEKKKIYGLLNHSIVIKCIILLVVITMNSSCARRGSSNYINPDEVNYIKFWYIDTNIIFVNAICDYDDVINMDECKYLKISDSSIVHQYVNIINNLHPINSTSCYDLRVTSVLVLKNKNNEYIKQIPIGIDLGGRVLNNGVLMADDSNNIVQFVKDKLYRQHSPRDWLPRDIQQHLEKHQEDTIYFFQNSN